MPEVFTGKRLLFFIPEDWYVCSHRLPLIAEAVRRGFAVTVVTRIDRHREPIERAGARVVPTRLRRGFRNPAQELAGLRHLIGVYKEVRPHLVHQVTPKSVLFGTIAARLAGVPRLVNALAGLGYVFTSSGLRARLLRPAVTLGYRSLLGRSHSGIIVQNPQDAEFFRRTIRIPAEQVHLIRGSGVDTSAFRPAAHLPDPGTLRVCLVARMISEKGIRECVAAARLVRRQRQDIEFVLAGDTDSESPSGIPSETLRGWHQEGIVRWLGNVANVPDLLRTCHIALLPTYREGFPKALLESAASGLPLIASDVPGCREICRPGVNGILIPPRDPDAIARAVLDLAAQPELRAAFGVASREITVAEFAEGIVVRQTMQLYEKMVLELETS